MTNAMKTKQADFNQEVTFNIRSEHSPKWHEVLGFEKVTPAATYYKEAMVQARRSVRKLLKLYRQEILVAWSGETVKIVRNGPISVMYFEGRADMLPMD